MKKKINDAAVFYKLDWDTKFFGVKSGKIKLFKSINTDQLKKLKYLITDYQFISIENLNSKTKNTKLLGEETNAFLVDTNVQFEKDLKLQTNNYKDIYIKNSLPKNKEILNLSKFEHSKFIRDRELFKRGGGKVYYYWLLNSFNKKDKYFAIFKNDNEVINGYILFSYKDDQCIIELISVSDDCRGLGIGSKLVQSVEHFVYNNGYKKIKVGTQTINHGAVNFYHKLGFKQKECHQIYHLWNL
jgi:ribosomal protein S18 acetylase RimI-like enzyme